MGVIRRNWNLVHKPQRREFAYAANDYRYSLAARPHRKPNTNYIPPWMAQKRAEEYLESNGEIPNDFGIPEFVTTAQWKAMHKRDCAYEDTVEKRIAWRFFARNISDCLNGNRAQKLRYIKECEIWANADENEFIYSFDYWTDVLEFDTSWARSKFNKFLQSAFAWAMMDTQPNEIKELLKEIAGKYKARPSSSRESNTSVNQQRATAIVHDPATRMV